MGAAYSVNGYINAALRRTGRTLLVEGVSDQAIVQRLCADADDPSPFTIDQAGIIASSDGRKMGNREKVLEVTRTARELLPNIPKLAHALAVLHDREWDGLPDGELRFTDEWVAPVQCSHQFSTLGHSIENYNFRVDHIVEYLKYAFSPDLKPGVQSLVRDAFSKIMVVASCLSLSCQEANVLSRVQGLMRYQYLSMDEGDFQVDDGFSAALVGRGCEPELANSVVRRARELMRLHAERLEISQASRWLPHGHLGEDCIWACVAYLAKECGVDTATCNSIGSSSQERTRYMATLISKSAANDITPLPDVVGWLTGSD